jgi:hypothetical protein
MIPGLDAMAAALQQQQWASGAPGHAVSQAALAAAAVEQHNCRYR